MHNSLSHDQNIQLMDVSLIQGVSRDLEPAAKALLQDPMFLPDFHAKPDFHGITQISWTPSVFIWPGLLILEPGERKEEFLVIGGLANYALLNRVNFNCSGSLVVPAWIRNDMLGQDPKHRAQFFLDDWAVSAWGVSRFVHGAKESVARTAELEQRYHIGHPPAQAVAKRLGISADTVSRARSEPRSQSASSSLDNRRIFSPLRTPTPRIIPPVEDEHLDLDDLW